MLALLRDTPWPNRESPYLHRGHIACLFATVSPGGLTVEIRFMPEELQWCPGISRRCFAPRCVPVSPGCFKNVETTGTTFRCIPIQCGACRRRYGVYRSAAGTENRDSVNVALILMRFEHPQLAKLCNNLYTRAILVNCDLIGLTLQWAYMLSTGCYGRLLWYTSAG